MISASSFNTLDKGKKIVDSTSVIPFEEMYQAIQSTSDTTINYHLLVALDMYQLPYWLEPPLPYLDFLLHTLPSDDSIMEVISLDEITWKDHHHRYSFLPK